MKPKVIEVKVENGVTVHRYKARAARGSSALRRWAAQRTFGVLGMEGKPTGFTSRPRLEPASSSRPISLAERQARMKVCYDHLTNSLRCTACGYDQELPGSYYGDPHAIVVAEEQMQSFHLCRSSETLTLPPIRTLRPAVHSARAVAMHVLGLKPA